MSADPSLPTLVLVPGLVCDEEIWAGQIHTLRHRSHIEVFPNARHGPLVSIGAMADALLSSQRAPRFSLADHSLGERVAVEVLRRAPRRVERLALLDTGWQPLPPGEAGERERAQRMELLQLARREGMVAMARRWSPGMLHPSRYRTPLHEAVIAMVARHEVTLYEAQLRALLARPDASDVLERIDCPTLVLCGREDAWSPLARHEQMAQHIRGARLVVVERCGHMSPMEQPEAVAEALGAWLDMPEGTEGAQGAPGRTTSQPAPCTPTPTAPRSAAASHPARAASRGAAVRSVPARRRCRRRLPARRRRAAAGPCRASRRRS